MGTPPPNPTETRSHLSGGSSRSRAMVHCGHLPPLILPLILIIAPSNTQGIPGCNSLLCQLLAQRGELTEVFAFPNQPPPHKRVPGMEFVGKRAPGMEFLGKRSGDTQFLHRNQLSLPEVLELELE